MMLKKAAKGKAAIGKELEILTPKQTIQGMPIALAKVRAGKTSQNLLNEIRQIIYSLYQAKDITEKIYRNMINSIKL